MGGWFTLVLVAGKESRREGFLFQDGRGVGRPELDRQNAFAHSLDS